MRWLRGLVSSWLARWRASRWTAHARRLLDGGDPLSAVAALQTALRIRPGSFGALLLLSRAYLRSRDLFRAQSALAQARATDRRRFEASAQAEIALEGYELARLCPDDGPRPAPASGPAAAGVEPARGVAVETQRRPGGDRTPLPLGDCRDVDEYARFKAMPPIQKGEIEDWDETLADLLDE